MTRYEQLAQQLREQIRAGVWQEGDKLPSLRETVRRSEYRTQQPQSYRVRVEGMESVHWSGADTVTVLAGEILNLPVSLAADPYLLSEPMYSIQFVAGNDELQVQADSQFFSPVR